MTDGEFLKTFGLMSDEERQTIVDLYERQESSEREANRISDKIGRLMAEYAHAYGVSAL